MSSAIVMVSATPVAGAVALPFPVGSGATNPVKFTSILYDELLFVSLLN